MCIIDNLNSLISLFVFVSIALLCYVFTFFLFYQVKREHSFLTRNKKGDKSKKKSEKIPFIYQDVPENVLGQHGIELLLERKTSFFESGAAGIICIGTKVILIKFVWILVYVDNGAPS